MWLGEQDDTDAVLVRRSGDRLPLRRSGILRRAGAGCHRPYNSGVTNAILLHPRFKRGRERLDVPV